MKTLRVNTLLSRLTGAGLSSVEPGFCRDRLPIRGNAPAGLRCLFAIELKALKPKPNGYPIEINSLGDHVRKARLDRGLLQDQIAKLIGVDEATICNWETNRTEPATGSMPGIIQFLGYCPYQLAVTFGQWLKQCRTTWGLSQEALAQAIAVDESTIAHWERGDHQPIRRMVDKVKEFFESDTTLAEFGPNR